MSKKQYVGFALLEISYWCFHASFIGYASAYLLDRGISNTVMSLLLSAYLLSAFIGSLVWGGVCDRHGANKTVFMAGMLTAFALMFLIYFFGSSAVLAALCYPLLGFFFQPQAANADAWVLSACGHDQTVYGKIRSMPSIAYAFISALMGRLIAGHGYPMMLVGGVFFMAVALAAAWRLPGVKAAGGQSGGMSFRAAARLFESRPYRRLIALLFLIGLAIAPINNLKIVVLENVGGNVAHIGVDSFVGALTQVPFIAMAGLLARLPLRRRFMAMAFLPLCMLLCTRFAVSPAMVFAGTFLSNIGYGLLLPTMRDVTERYVSKDLRNLGHSLSDAVYNSFSGVVSLMYAGAVIDGFGVSAMLTLCVCIAAVPAAASFLPLRADS